MREIMETPTAAIIDQRLYRVGQRCSHPFQDCIGGVVVTAIHVTDAKAGPEGVAVCFDDGTKLTTSAARAVLCWAAPGEGPAKPVAPPSRKAAKTTTRKRTKTSRKKASA